MAKVNKISSFKSFTEIRKQESVSKLREENNLKRQESVGKIAAILDELGLTSFEGLEEDQKESIISKIFGDVSEEEIAEIEVEVEEVTEKEGVKHYTADGKEWTGPTHKMPDGTLMTQNPHSEDSEKLFHKEDLKESTTYNVIDKATGETITDEPLKKDLAKKFAAKKKGWVIKAVNEASEEDKPYFDFLVALRDSGATNMFGAAPYLQNEFGMSKGEARKILTKWMKSFSESAVTEKKAGFVAIYKVMGQEFKFGPLKTDDKKSIMAMLSNAIQGGFQLVRVVPADQVKEEVVTEAKDPYKEIKKATKNMKGVSCDIKGDTIIVSNKAGDEFTYSMNDADDIEEFIATIEESVVTESIKCTNKKGHSYKEIDKDGTVECEHCGLRNSLSEEVEEVTEAKFVKDFDKDVLDAEYKADITTYYPSAQFFVGKMSHFFGQLEDNLFFKAYYAKYYKEDTGKKIDGEFKITSVYSRKGSNYVNLYLEESANTVEAPKVNEAEVKSDEDFKEYAFAVLGKAFGDKFDEEKAQEVVDGLLSKHGEDYGAAVGALTASLG